MIKIPREKFCELLSDYKGQIIDWTPYYSFFPFDPTFWSRFKGMWYVKNDINYFLTKKEVLSILNKILNTNYKKIDIEYEYRSTLDICLITYIVLK